MTEIQKQLFSMRDEKFGDFLSRLIPGISRDSIIGVRTPNLRKYAKEYQKDTEARDEFFDSIPHRYYEENMLHGFMIEGIKDYDEVIKRIDAFLPYVDNWATCDQINPKLFKKSKDRLMKDIDRWISSDKLYTVRFGIEMIMNHYLDEAFDRKYLDKVAALKSDEYYQKMMVAWFFATALTKHYDETLPILSNRVLDRWTHNKAIQKARESLRMTKEQKEFLNTLKY